MKRLAITSMSLGCAFLLAGTISLAVDLYSYGAEVHQQRLAVREESRHAIDAYTAKTGKAPRTLADLAKAGYTVCLPQQIS